MGIFDRKKLDKTENIKRPEAWYILNKQLKMWPLPFCLPPSSPNPL